MADTPVGYDGNPLGPTNGGSAPTPAGNSNVKDLAALASLAPLIINMFKGSSQPNPGALLGTIPGGQDLLNSVTGQQQQQAPLRQAVTQQAMNMLPNSAFPGGRPALSPVGAGPAPVASPNGSGLDIAKLLGAGAAGGGIAAALAKLLGGGAPGGGSADLGKLLQAFKNALAGKPAGLSQPFPGGALPSGNPGMNGFTGFDPSGDPNYSRDPNGNYGPPDPTPNVDTSFNFGSDPTLSAYQPPDFSTLPGYGTALPPLRGGGGDGGNAWDE